MKIPLLAILVLNAALAVAHHDPAAYYDPTKPITLKGTVTDFVRVNPHAFILMDVRNAKGVVESWAVEGDAPNTLTSGGWTPTTLKRGDAVTVTAYPLKPGARVASTIVIPNSSLELATLLRKVAERLNAEYGAHGTEVTLSDGRKLLFGHIRRYWSITR